MHKVKANIAQGLKKPAKSPRAVALWAVFALAGLALVAWIDGGEEPIRAISQPVKTPLQGRS